jgi:hypothetical protein
VHSGDEGVSLRLAGGEEVRGRAAILAVAPETACDLFDLPADSCDGRLLVGWVEPRFIEARPTGLANAQKFLGSL